ncbi:ATP-dependent helicase [Candidatus Poriferisocius sp.]|uniref:ATP-dependent helicase n=1 Tax=Candidatus Poriferisocius sp. TaxID=3101276 RepID=UPI003B02B41A
MPAALAVTDPEELLSGLNERQKAAVSTQSIPLCIRAGAGTGKTRVLTRRIAYQSLTGRIDPRRTLALTFTRKAAAELRNRLTGLGLESSASAGTFHSTAYAQLRIRWAEQGVRALELMSNKLGLMARIARKGKQRLDRTGLLEVATEIEWAKARRIQPECYAESAVQARRWSGMEPALIGDFYQQYENEKRKQSTVDFDDLLILALNDLNEDPDYAEAIRWRFQHLFVDEFQDVNPLQFELLQAWLGNRNDLCAVGDSNQAIYRWNGAEADYIQRFDHWFPDAQMLDLVDNYRSSPQILTAAKNVLGASANSLEATCADGPRPTVSSHANHWDEADDIARMLRDAKGPEVAWSSMAVLVRTNAQIATLTSALERATIPFRIRIRTTAHHLENNSPLSSDPKIDQSIDGVDVVTFHAAKGLEWPIVHLAGLEQGLVPIGHAQEPAERAEEQRLLHVAITRAERELHCHWAAERVFGDRTVPRTPSCYLGAILETG